MGDNYLASVPPTPILCPKQAFLTDATFTNEASYGLKIPLNITDQGVTLWLSKQPLEMNRFCHCYPTF